MTEIQNTIIAKAVDNLKEYGYPSATEENIFTDEIYGLFFYQMLEDNLGNGFDEDLKSIMSKIHFDKAKSN